MLPQPHRAEPIRPERPRPARKLVNRPLLDHGVEIALSDEHPCLARIVERVHLRRARVLERVDAHGDRAALAVGVGAERPQHARATVHLRQHRQHLTRLVRHRTSHEGGPVVPAAEIAQAGGGHLDGRRVGETKAKRYKDDKAGGRGGAKKAEADE
eukprot:2785722-Pleurochrysis_carterae.AAC.2